MADQKTTAEARKNVQTVVGASLTAMGEGMFPLLALLDLDQRAEAVDALYSRGNMPAEVAMALMIDPLAVGEMIATNPTLSLLMRAAAETAAYGIDPELLDNIEHDAAVLENALKEGE